MVALDADTGELLKMHHELMNNKNKLPDFWSKIEHMRVAFDAFHEPNWNVERIAVEENAKRFTPGFSSADTIITLAKFNGVLCYLMYVKYGLKPFYINVRSARSKLGIKINYKDKSKTTKQKVLDHVTTLHPDYPWVYREVKGKKTLTKINEDRADAWIMAAAANIMPG